MKKKLTCHCGSVEAEVQVSEDGFKKIMRCNCSLCKRKGYIIGVIGPDDLKIVKGENLLKLYQYHTKTAKHYFCSICGIYTHHQRRSKPHQYGINIACINGVNIEDYLYVEYIEGKGFFNDETWKSTKVGPYES